MWYKGSRIVELPVVQPHVVFRIFCAPPSPPVFFELVLDSPIYDIVPLELPVRLKNSCEMSTLLLFLTVENRVHRFTCIYLQRGYYSESVSIKSERCPVNLYTPPFNRHMLLETVEPLVRQLLELPLAVQTHLPAR